MAYRAVRETRVFGKLTHKARQSYDRALRDLEQDIREAIHSYGRMTWNATLDDGIMIIEGEKFYIEQLVAGQAPKMVGVRHADR